MSESDTNKRCVNCNIDMTVDAAPSKFDQKYCTYCQNQDNGTFDASHYAKVYEFISQKFFPLIHSMNEKESKANAATLIRFNPGLLLKFPCIT